MRRRLPAPLGLALIVLLLPAAAGGEQGVVPAAGGPWQGPDGPLPFATEDELKDYLRTAPIVSKEEITSGTNRPFKVRLEQDGVEANAIFRTVDIRQRKARLDGKIVMDFHDSHVYECAAYEVSRLLGIDRVPPCVKRRVSMMDGTVQLWVENATTELDRREAGQEPPQLIVWLRQKQTMKLFDALIYNFDRNQGNMLITPDWKLWFIDHTRSFRKSSVIERIEKIIWCERGIWERLQALDKKQLSRRLKPLISSLQINLLLKRRDKLVAHLQERIDRLGEGGVIYDAGDAGDASPAGLIEIPEDDDYPETSSQLEDPAGRR